MDDPNNISVRTTASSWRTVPDPKQARQMFSQNLLHKHKHQRSLFLSVDLGCDKQEQDQALVAFYKKGNVQWASPLRCRLQGDVATGSGVSRHVMSTVICKLISGFHINFGNAGITKLFEGEPDHLIPSVSGELLQHHMFTAAGRMVGLSFLHNGPSFPGISPAILHVLFGGLLETTPLTIQDCPDLDIRDTVQMLEGGEEIQESDSVHQLCHSWNLPEPNASNRKWLSEKILFHAVIGRTKHQISQFREGLKETGLWPLLIQRRDMIPVLFPRESEAQLTPQMILDCITWPSSITVFFESFRDIDHEESDTRDVQRVSGYLRRFIENASAVDLKSLIKFWIGWELPAPEMRVEVVEAWLPTASTCFEKLRLPRHYTSYSHFQQDLSACITTSYSGFGCP